MKKTYEEDEGREIKLNVVKIIGFSFVFIIALIIIFNTAYIVKAGERGVLLTFGKPADVPMGEGLHIKVPIVQTVVHMDVKTMKYETDASAASNDLQIVTTKLAVNYHVLPESTPEIYRTMSYNYQERVIQPAVQEVVKASTAKYTAEQLITKRAEVKEDIKNLLHERLLIRGIIVEDISIVNFDFSPEFNQAIELKVTAEQNALAAKNKLEQVKFEAEQRIVQSKAEAEAIRIQAEAMTAQGGKEDVQLQAISKWSGILPVVTGGSTPFINMTSLLGG
jgi:regulator of protease activity HflC (stomatin/prohibitin superfamily)